MKNMEIIFSQNSPNNKSFNQLYFMLKGYPKNVANNILLSSPEETYPEIFIKMKLLGICC